MVLRSYPVSRLMARMLSPCRFNSSISCTSFPRNTSRLLLHSRVGAGLQPRLGGGGFFERHYGDFTTGADIGTISFIVPPPQLNVVAAFFYDGTSTTYLKQTVEGM